MPSWPKPSGKEKALIVDLRMNGGGDAAVEAVNGWVDPKDLEASTEFSQRVGASCLYPALRWGYTVKSSRKLTPPISEEMRQQLQENLGEVFAPSEPECPAKYVEKASAWNLTKHKAGAARRKGKPLVLVLVDNGCGSDCEYMAYVLAGVPKAVLVGVNTFGVGQFIQPGYSVLPNTRVGFSVALGTSNMYGDNRSYDGYGMDVDVLLSTEQAWSRQGLLELVDQLTAER
jgi:C-terminal processing protease CtpA/Prc